jgi:cysteine synthase
MRYEDIFQMVGKTPHVKLKFGSGIGNGRRNDSSIFIKLEGQNTTGSVKDRTGVALLQDVIRRGELKPGMTVLDASSGNLGCSLAFYSKLFGYRAFIVSSSKLTDEKRDFMLYYGAEVYQTGNWTIEGNQYCRELVQQEPGRYCFLDQLHNWGNPRAHYESTGPEIMAEFPKLEMVVGSLGTGGFLLGTGQFIKQHSPHVKIVAVQSALGTRLAGTASLDEGDYVTPFIENGYASKIFDHTVKVTEADAISRTFQLRDQGIFCGLQTGGVLHAALAAVDQHNIKGEVVVLSGDAGWKNMDKLIGFMENRAAFAH